MKKINSQKGSALTIVIIVAVIVIAALGYMTFRNTDGTGTPIASESPTASTSPSTTASSTPSATVSPSPSATATVAPVTYSVIPAKESFKEGEPITFKFTVTNNTNESRTFNFTSGCQTAYSVGTFDASKDMVCTLALTSFTIAPKGTKEFTMTHPASAFRLPVGVFTLKAQLIGYGEAQSQVTITK